MKLSYRNTALNHEITVEGPEADWVIKMWNKGMRLLYPMWNYRHNRRDKKGRWVSTLPAARDE